MDDRFTTRLRTAMGDQPRGDPPGADPRPTMPVRAPLYVRRPSLWRRAAAIAVALLLLGLVSLWLELRQALVLWALFTLFVLLWPNWPAPTPAEERTQAWPFEP